MQDFRVLNSRSPGRVVILVEGGDAEHRPKGRAGWGGYIRYWEPALRGLQARGYDVTLATTSGRTPLHEVAEGLSLSTFALGAESRLHFPRAVYRLRRELSHRNIEIVHANEAIQAMLAGAAVTRSSIRTIFHRHHLAIAAQPRLYTWLANRYSNLTMAVSSAVAERARAEGVSNICVAPNGMDQPPTGSNEAARLRASLEIPEGDTVLLVVGHLRPEKGHRIALDAIRHLGGSGSNKIHLVFVGDGPERAKLVDQIAESRLQDVVRLVGHQENVGDWYLASNIVLVPSFSEPFGLVAIEAMACRRPVVASAVDGLAEIVRPGENGLLVPPGDSPALAEAIRGVVADPELARRWASGGESTWRNEFSVDSMLDGWERCYARSWSAGLS